MRRWLLGLVVALLSTAEAVILVPLQKRHKTIEEERQLLELLSLSEGSGSADTKPPATLLDSNFFGTIQIGDNKQEFKVVFDTGSSVLWVYSDKCEVCKGSEKHMFSPAKSTTFHHRPIPFSIKYGTGESKGSTGTDEIFLADLEVHDQAFGQCDEPDSVMRGFPFDGIVGLSRALINDKNKMPTIISTIKNEKLLASRQLGNSFSFYIGREEGDPTYLMFGASHDMLEADARIHWTNTLNKNIYWEIPLDDIFIHPKPGHAPVHNEHEEQPAGDGTPEAEAESENEASGDQVGDDAMLEEQHPTRAENDPFAALDADVEVALLETTAFTHRLRRHLTPSARSHRALAQFPSAPPALAGSRRQHRHAIREARGLEADEVRMQAAREGKREEGREGREEEARELEDRVRVRSVPHKVKTASPPAAKGVTTEPIAEDGERGSGQLLSQLHTSPGQSMNPCQQDEAHMCLISVDSGHSLMSGPPDIIKPIKAALAPPNGGDACEDAVMATMPDISFAIGGKLFTLTPEDYLIKLEGKCVPAFSERVTRNGHDWVLGEHFMRTFYTVFDHDNSRVGLAHLDQIKPHLGTIMKTGSLRESPKDGAKAS